MRSLLLLCLLALAFTVFTDCDASKNKPVVKVVSTSLQQQQNERAFVKAMRTHLDAVSNRDLKTLRNTLSPDGRMQLILPGTEIIDGVEGFMDYHVDWFKDTSWTFETNVLRTNIGDRLGLAITEVVYREPERNGVPYFNRMIVSYDLEKTDGHWYVIKDHASSVEKSTDNPN